MNSVRHGRLWSAVAAAGCLLGNAGAIQLRTADPARHDRFTGFPAAPAWNDAAWFGSRGYAGVGWAPADPVNQRQFALVSPQHLVCATHFQPKVGAVIRFLNTDGSTVDRSVNARLPVENDAGQASDLTLLRLSAPMLPADKVPHFPFLDLAAEADYRNADLIVFGWHARAGKGRIAAIEDIEEGTAINLTRALRFDYPKKVGQPDDCYLETGDSGSPSFGTVDGRPAVVGTHSTIDENVVARQNYDTFVPHYAAKLNVLMEPDGYRMMSSNPPPVVLAVTALASPEPWRQAMAATCRYELTNTSANDAANPTVRLRFPPDRMPATLDAPGWVVIDSANGERILHRATLPAGASVSITAGWTDTGSGDTLTQFLELGADGMALQNHDFSRDLAPSYQAWAADLADPDAAADGDADGVPNLLEYAFGGDPHTPSRYQPAGAPLLPQTAVADQTVTVRFPERDDAARRGLAYVVEFSTTLAGGSWSATPPPGFTDSNGPLEPAAPGFHLRTLTVPADAPRSFYRVRVELDE